MFNELFKGLNSNGKIYHDLFIQKTIKFLLLFAIIRSDFVNPFVISFQQGSRDPRADEPRRKCRWQFAKLPVPLSPWDRAMGIRGGAFSARRPVFRGSSKELCAYCMLIGIPSRIYPGMYPLPAYRLKISPEPGEPRVVRIHSPIHSVPYLPSVDLGIF